MAVAKRIFLFIILNLLVITTLTLVLSLLGVKPYLTARGIDYPSLMTFCLIWGMGGALISLALSRIMAKWAMGVRIIDPSDTSDPRLQNLVLMVHKLCHEANLHYLPQVGVYSSHELNAFATGPSQKRALVAVSSGLLNRMSSDEIEGVLAHEISHISNGDMVTMTLIQGVVNAFVMFLARVLALAVSGLGNRKDSSSAGSYMSYNLFVILFQIAFMVLDRSLLLGFLELENFEQTMMELYLQGKKR